MNTLQFERAEGLIETENLGLFENSIFPVIVDLYKEGYLKHEIIDYLKTKIESIVDVEIIEKFKHKKGY